MPATPPAQDNTSEKVSCDPLVTVHVAAAEHADFVRQHRETSVEVSGVAALDRCVILCRFSL